MRWPWTPLANARRERDHALVRVATLEARCRDLEAAHEQLRAEMREERKALFRITDNALLAAGCAPIFEPERGAVRSADAQQSDAHRAQAKAPKSPAEWRRQVESLDAEAAARDRKATLREELRREAEGRRASKS